MAATFKSNGAARLALVRVCRNVRTSAVTSANEEPEVSD
jgi:hypothetical protein